MTDTPGLAQQTQLTYERLQTRLQARFASLVTTQPLEWAAFQARWRAQFPPLFERLYTLYSTRYDFFYHLEELAALLVEAALERPPALRALDAEREQNPQWFQSNRMLGGVCYVDLFAGNLEGVRAHIPYFQELGLTYLHLMPLFKVPTPENDGGYAVSSYREINPALGTMEQLRELATALHQAGIVLVLDFVFNHTAYDHIWAQRALAGDPAYADYYFIFPDRTLPDAYDKTLREIFPDVRRGAFTRVPRTPFTLQEQDLDTSFVPALFKPVDPRLPFAAVEPSATAPDPDHVWVWTTFHPFQWDLNYRNPAVFNSMAREMLFLANQGIDVLRLDAVAFIWKELGTSSENLSEAHLLIQAFNALARIAAPGLLFKSEAIVHPDDVVKYISAEECQLSYNPLLMALLWNTLATREVQLLDQALRERFVLSPDVAWVNYVRVHDDIGWTFSDEDAALLGINGYAHRRFLNAFYTGKFPGSFARGLPFQENPDTGDLRISGTCASLAGLEQALDDDDPAEIELAIRRILLLHGIITLAGGIPLLYLGDEIGTLNDYTFLDEPVHASDSRWVHRPEFDWVRATARHDPATIPGKIYLGLRQLIALRQSNPSVAGGKLIVHATGNPHVLAFERPGAPSLLILANFSEQSQPLENEKLRAAFSQSELLYGAAPLSPDGALEPYGLYVSRSPV